MDADEKLMALKKTYADVMVNMSKEAAARVLASERKGLRYQQELKVAKEEALRMMLFLKQMMDFKISEAESSSLNQQKKIEELDAQLHEAEDIVGDLRHELRVTQDDLERVKKENLKLVNNATNAQPCTFLPPKSQEESNVPSIILRGNGCTHRIRACEKNQLDKELCEKSLIRKKKRAIRSRKTITPSSGKKSHLVPKLGQLPELSGLNEKIVPIEETGFAENLQSPMIRDEVAKVDVPSNSSMKGLDSGERVIKITFQRKRRRQAISESGVNSSEIVKKMGDAQNGDGEVELPKYNLVVESPGDSRRLAQVARQLISLSEKKWWH